MTSLTADLALNDAAINAGSSLLVIGASGMVGGAVVQLAKRLGAQIIAVVRDEPHEAARLGADHVLLNNDNLDRSVQRIAPDGVDARVDTVGGEGRSALLELIADGGRYVMTTTDLLSPAQRGITPRAIQVQPNAGRLAQLASLAAEGELEARVAEVIPLTDGARAFQPAHKQRGPGKLVLTP